MILNKQNKQHNHMEMFKAEEYRVIKIFVICSTLKHLVLLNKLFMLSNQNEDNFVIFKQISFPLFAH